MCVGYLLKLQHNNELLKRLILLYIPLHTSIRD